MKKAFYVVAIALLQLTVPTIAQKNYRVMFDKPISNENNPPAWDVSAGYGRPNGDAAWERYTLPIGNGYIGANIYGNIAEERITFNEKSLWAGGPNVTSDPAYYWDINKKSAHVLPEIRQAFLDGDNALADRLTRDNFNGYADYEPSREQPYRYGYFSTMGEFRITTGLSNDFTSYSRVLSLDSALVDVDFVQDGTRYSREYFCSYPDSVFVAKYTASKPGKQNLEFSYLIPSNINGQFNKIANNHLQFVGNLKENNQQMALDFICNVDKGSVEIKDNKIIVKGANEAVFTVVASTDYYMNFDPDFSDRYTYVGESAPSKNAAKVAWLKGKDYNQLLATHVKDYQTLFNRVDLQLNTANDNQLLPTGERLAAYKNGDEDFQLESLYFQFGRYLLISSSRKGALPANLQGIWHNNIDGPWHVDYHNNINLQMNYWPVSVTNLNECAQPLFDFIRTLIKSGKVTAESYFGARGWTASISSNIYGFTSPFTDKDMSWNYNPVAGPWLATHIWDYYDYTRDLDFLKENYDILKQSAQFAVDLMWKRPDGLYSATPSTSPEHGPIDQGATYAHAIVKEVLLDAIAASEILKCDKKERKEWENILAKIDPYKIGRYGQLQEWYDDIDDPKTNHRHVNHLYGLHPGRTISPITTPNLAEASEVVLVHRGDFATGWSMGWKLNQWARLHNGNHSYMLYQNLLKQGTVPNLWDTHPPFQIDGNFGGTAGIAEMLLQSHMGFIHLLPALPDAWKDGKLTGVMARGNFVVDLSWSNNKLTKAIITSNSGGKCSVYYDGKELSFKTVKGGVYEVDYANDKMSYKKL